MDTHYEEFEVRVTRVATTNLLYAIRETEKGPVLYKMKSSVPGFENGFTESQVEAKYLVKVSVSNPWDIIEATLL